MALWGSGGCFPLHPSSGPPGTVLSSTPAIHPARDLLWPIASPAGAVLECAHVDSSQGSPGPYSWGQPPARLQWSCLFLGAGPQASPSTLGSRQRWPGCHSPGFPAQSQLLLPNYTLRVAPEMTACGANRCPGPLVTEHCRLRHPRGVHGWARLSGVVQGPPPQSMAF